MDSLEDDLDDANEATDVERDPGVDSDIDPDAQDVLPDDAEQPDENLLGSLDDDLALWGTNPDDLTIRDDPFDTDSPE